MAKVGQGVSMHTKKYSQEPPFCIQVEMSEGCNLYCDFCGLTGIRRKEEKNFKFLSKKNAEKIAINIARSGWSSRIEFAQHGEPTMNPNFIDIVDIFRQHLPDNQLMMTSNGGGLLSDTVSKIEELFNAGLNILALDAYEYVNIVPKIKERLFGHSISQYYYPENKEFSPHRRWPKGTAAIIYIKDISIADKGNHATISNHCGAARPLSFDKNGKRCAKPFRELAIFHDGHVKACCQDWFGISIFGNTVSQDIISIWNNELFTALRKKMYAGERDIPPCYGCDYTTYRNGLLPDKKGKCSMPKPTKKDNDLLLNNIRRPMNKPISEVAISTIKVWKK